jgi:hypothetical protein
MTLGPKLVINIDLHHELKLPYVLQYHRLPLLPVSFHQVTTPLQSSRCSSCERSHNFCPVVRGWKVSSRHVMCRPNKLDRQPACGAITYVNDSLPAISDPSGLHAHEVTLVLAPRSFDLTTITAFCFSRLRVSHIRKVESFEHVKNR